MTSGYFMVSKELYHTMSPYDLISPVYYCFSTALLKLHWLGKQCRKSLSARESQILSAGQLSEQWGFLFPSNSKLLWAPKMKELGQRSTWLGSIYVSFEDCQREWICFDFEWWTQGQIQSLLERTHLEYSVQLWGIQHKTDTDLLE